MREGQEHGLNNPTVRKNRVNDDQMQGHSSPNARKGVVLAATDMYCSICDAEPCYLLTTAAMSVVHEQLTENNCYDTTNLISAVQYAQSLERLHGCITRHIEVTREAWQLYARWTVKSRASQGSWLY
jgi:hypothetical protein